MRAPYESTMGLVQKIFYFHMPVRVACSCRGDHRRRGQRHLPVRQEQIGRRMGAGGGGTGGAVRHHLLVTGPLWARKAWGIWWEWDARLTSSLHAVDDLRRLSAAAPLRRARFGEARRRHGAVRAGQRAVHLRVGERLAHAPSADHGRAHPARADGRSAVVLCRLPSCCCSWSCSACGRGSSASVCVSKTSTSPRTKRDAILSSVVVLPPCCCPRPSPTRRSPKPSADEFVPMEEVPRVRADPRASTSLRRRTASCGSWWWAMSGRSAAGCRRPNRKSRDLERRAARWTSACRRPPTSSTSRSCC